MYWGNNLMFRANCLFEGNLLCVEYKQTVFSNKVSWSFASGKEKNSFLTTVNLILHGLLKNEIAPYRMDFMKLLQTPKL